MRDLSEKFLGDKQPKITDSIDMIKKIILWTIAVLVLLAIVAWGGYILRQQESYKSLVHKKSKALLTVSLDDILLNQFFNKWQSAPKEGQVFGQKLSKLKDNGIDIKANVFLFALEPHPKNFYAFFQLKDKQQFLTFLKDVIQVGAVESNLAPDVSYAYHQPSKIAFIWKGDDLLLSLGFDLDTKKEEMLQLIQSKEDRVTIEQFINRPSTLTGKSLRYSDISTDNFIELDLKGDHLDVSGEFFSTDWNFPKEYLVRELVSAKYIGKAWINIPSSQLKNQLKQLVSELPIAADSIIAHLDGNYVDIEILKNKVIQTDTIINYAVDENFETIEEKTPYETKVPEVRLAMRGDNDMRRFLPSKLFYQWFQKQDKEFSLLTTSKDIDKLNVAYSKTAELSHVAVHLVDWPNEAKISPILLLKTIASDITLTLKVVDHNRLVLQGTIADYSH